MTDLDKTMANKDTRRSKEIRKPKRPKAAPAAAAWPFKITPGRPPPPAKG
jgi:hypothetical protein